MATKFGTKLAITRLAGVVAVADFCEIVALNALVGKFSGMGHRMLPIAFFPTDPRCHGNEIWDKIGYNSACVKNLI